MPVVDEEYDPYKGESGLKDDYDGTVVDAWFATNANAQNAMQAYLKVLADDGEEVELRYGVGSDWGSFDGGDTVEHPAGKTKGFNNRTAYYSFFAKALEVGGEEELRRRSREQYDGLGPKAAKSWIGTRWHFEVHTETMNLPDRNDPSGERKPTEVSRVLPTKFLGVATVTDGQVSGVTPAASPPAQSPAAAPTNTTAQTPTNTSTQGAVTGVGQEGTAGAGDPLAALSDEGRAKAKILAKSQEYSQWVDSMLELDGVVGNATLVAALGSEEFYQRLRDS